MLFTLVQPFQKLYSIPESSVLTEQLRILLNGFKSFLFLFLKHIPQLVYMPSQPPDHGYSPCPGVNSSYLWRGLIFEKICHR